MRKNGSQYDLLSGKRNVRGRSNILDPFLKELPLMCELDAQLAICWYIHGSHPLHQVLCYLLGLCPRFFFQPSFKIHLPHFLTEFISFFDQ